MEIDRPVTDLRGVGPRRAQVLADAGIYTLADLLSLYPRDYIDTTRLPSWREAAHGERAYVIGRVAGAISTPPRLLQV